MNCLEKRILKDGVVKPGNVLKVDSFLNHQMDIGLMNEIGEEFYRRFQDLKINKILTIEASGIAIAYAVQGACAVCKEVQEHQHRRRYLCCGCGVLYPPESE